MSDARERLGIGTCETCIFWSMFPQEHQAHGVTNGLCHRSPPMVAFAGIAQVNRIQVATGDATQGGVTQFATRPPVTDSSFWCGEYRKVPAEASPSANDDAIKVA